MDSKGTTVGGAGRYWFYFFIIIAIVIKFSYFFYAITVIPKIFVEQDSPVYLQGADSIRSFFLHPQLGLMHNSQALPGYPLVLAICLHGLGLAIPQMIFIQILLNFCAAFIVSRIASSINPNWASLCVLIVLLDLPLTIYSQLIMTEAVFIVAISYFILSFHRYLQDPSLKRLIFAAFALVLCLYIRPVTCYLPWFVAAFIICYRCPGHWKKSIAHAVLLLLVAYGLCFPWQYRNYKRFGDLRMSTIDKYTIKKHSFFKDSDEKKFVVAPTMPKYLYYTYAFSRNVIELTTTPGSMKDTLCMSWMVFCGGFGYCLIVFWFPGFLIGLVKIENDVRYYFLIWIFLYFLLATIGATGWTVTSRFRIAMLPSISVISSAGWFKIRSWYLNRNSKTPVY